MTSSAGSTSAYDEQGHAPARVGEQDVEPEADLGHHAEACQGPEPPEVDREDRRVASLQPAQEHGEAYAEEEGEGAPGLLLDEYPHAPADQVLQAGHLEPHLLVEVHQDHSEQRQPAQDVEPVQALIGVQRSR